MRVMLLRGNSTEGYNAAVKAIVIAVPSRICVSVPILSRRCVSLRIRAYPNIK